MPASNFSETDKNNGEGERERKRWTDTQRDAGSRKTEVVDGGQKHIV